MLYGYDLKTRECTRGIVVVHLYCSFSIRRQDLRWRHSKAQSSEPLFLVNFVPVWGRI